MAIKNEASVLGLDHVTRCPLGGDHPATIEEHDYGR